MVYLTQLLLFSEICICSASCLPSSYYYPRSCYRTLIATKGVAFVKLYVCVYNIIPSLIVSTGKYIPLDYNLTGKL